jgi:hypothetical protein
MIRKLPLLVDDREQGVVATSRIVSHRAGHQAGRVERYLR